VGKPAKTRIRQNVAKGNWKPVITTSKDAEKKVEEMMRLYLDYVSKQNISMQFWKVGAPKTKPFKKSQYEKWNNQLHTDFGEDLMKHPANDHPMSMIMALDEFKFAYQNPLDKDDDGNDDDNDDNNLNNNDNDVGSGNDSGDDDEYDYNEYNDYDNDKEDYDDYKTVRGQKASNGPDDEKRGREKR
jgi:hypothetical protein